MSHLPTLGGPSGPPMPFPAAVLAHLGVDKSARQQPIGRGKIFAGTNSSDCGAALSPMAIVYQGPSLEVICSRSGERLAAWTFNTEDPRKNFVSSSKQNQQRAAASDEFDVGVVGGGPRTTEITCVTEMTLSVSRHVGPVISSQMPASDDASFASSTVASRHQVQRLAVVGLSSGLVCLIDIKSCRMVRAVRMPHRVTAIAVISHGSGGGDDDVGGSAAASLLANRNLAEELLFFHGIIVVGTQEGHLYLLDAALDFMDMGESEKNPAELYFLPGPKRPKPDSLATLRASAHQRGEHLCIALNDDAYSRKVFKYASHMTGDVTYFPEDGVVVSSLLYVPQLGNVLVGFNFGSWQMWNMSRLHLDFASSYDGVEPPNTSSAASTSSVVSSTTLPVIGFTFAEPENDPRNFCYVWVARGENDFDLVNEKLDTLTSKSTISLYALSYKNRDDGGDIYGALYSGLTSCALRFDHTLLGDPQTSLERQVTGSTCLACYTLGNSVAPMASNANESDQDTLLSKAGITLFLWEVNFVGSRNNSFNDDNLDQTLEKTTKYYMGLFDLNAWYQAHMPIQVELEQQAQCSYFSYCSMDDVYINDSDASVAGDDSLTQQQLIDVWVDVTSLSRHCQSTTTVVTTSTSLGIAPHVTPVRPEQHFYPSALTFDLVCLFNGGFVHANHLGLQRKVLLELQSQGRSAMVEPGDLYQLCRIAGLIVNAGITILDQEEDSSRSSIVDDDVDSVSTVDQRSALMTVALENNLVNLLTDCVFHWSDGKYSEAGCTLKFILDWAWTSISSIKQTIDKATVCLFDCSELDLNDTSRRSLMQRSQQLHHLCTIIRKAFDVVRANRWRHLQMLNQQLSLKLHLGQLISTYLDVIIWFLSARLLPEQIEDDSSVFPISHLRQVYTEKRQRMRHLLTEWSESDCFADETVFKNLLLIDGLCEELGPKFKENLEREGNQIGLYPPPTLHAILVAYLIHNDSAAELDDNQNLEEMNTALNLAEKHRLIQYMFLDLASCLASRSENGDISNSAVVESLIKFPSAFGMPPSIIKLTQAFWLVDHEDFDEAIAILLDPLICANDISCWQHRAIIITFLIQDRAKLALKYSQIRQPPLKDISDVQLHVSILLANGMVHEAFQFLRRRWTGSGSQPVDSDRDKQILLYYFFNRCDAIGKLDSILQLPMLTTEENILVDFLLNSDEEHRKESLLLYYLQRSRYSEAIALHEKLGPRFSTNDQGQSKTRAAIMSRYAHILPKLGGRNNFGSLQARWPNANATSTYPQPIANLMMKAANTQPVFSTSAAFQRMNEFNSPFAQMSNGSNEFTPFRPQHRRRKWGDMEAEAEVDQDHSQQSKRGRLDLESSQTTMTSTMTSTLTKNMAAAVTDASSLLSSCSLLSVLTTPIIERQQRRVNSILGRTSQSSWLADDQQQQRCLTPHSILKVKATSSASLTSGNQSPMSMLFNSLKQQRPEVDEGDDDEEEEEERWASRQRLLSSASRESTPGKSLRFNVPKRLPPPMEDISGEDEPEVTEKTVRIDSPKSVTSRRRPEEDDSIVLVSDDEDEDVQVPEGLEQRREEVSVTTPIKAVDAEDEDVSFATPESFKESQSPQSTVSNRSVRHRPEVSFYGHQETLPMDESYIRELARQDVAEEEEESHTMASPTMSPPSTGSSQKSSRSNVTFYGPDVTMPVDVSFIRQLAQQDAEQMSSTSPESTRPTKMPTPVSTRKSNSTLSNDTFYGGGDETFQMDMSLIRQLASQDAERHQVAADDSTTSQSQLSTTRDNSSASFYEANVTIPVDITLVKNLAKADAVAISADASTISVSHQEDPDNLVTPASVRKRKRFMDSSVSQLESILEEGRPMTTAVSDSPSKSALQDQKFRFKKLDVPSSASKRIRTCSATAASPSAVATPTGRSRRARASQSATEEMLSTPVSRVPEPSACSKTPETTLTTPSTSRRGRTSTSMSETASTKRGRRTRSSVSEADPEPLAEVFPEIVEPVPDPMDEPVPVIVVSVDEVAAFAADSQAAEITIETITEVADMTPTITMSAATSKSRPTSSRSKLSASLSHPSPAIKADESLSRSRGRRTKSSLSASSVSNEAPLETSRRNKSSLSATCVSPAQAETSRRSKTLSSASPAPTESSRRKKSSSSTTAASPVKVEASDKSKSASTSALKVSPAKPEASHKTRTSPLVTTSSPASSASPAKNAPYGQSKVQPDLLSVPGSSPASASPAKQSSSATTTPSRSRGSRTKSSTSHTSETGEDAPDANVSSRPSKSASTPTVSQRRNRKPETEQLIDALSPKANTSVSTRSSLRSSTTTASSEAPSPPKRSSSTPARTTPSRRAGNRSVAPQLSPILEKPGQKATMNDSNKVEKTLSKSPAKITSTVAKTPSSSARPAARRTMSIAAATQTTPSMGALPPVRRSSRSSAKTAKEVEVDLSVKASPIKKSTDSLAAAIVEEPELNDEAVVTPEKSVKRSSAKRRTASASVVDTVVVDATAAKSRRSRRTTSQVHIPDPFSPVLDPGEVAEAAAAEPHKKRKYVAKKTIKSFKIV